PCTIFELHFESPPGLPVEIRDCIPNWQGSPVVPDYLHNLGEAAVWVDYILRVEDRWDPLTRFLPGNRNCESCLSPLRSSFRCFLSITTEYMIRRTRRPV